MGLFSVALSARALDYPIAPVPFTDVTLTDSFWAPRQATNRQVTVEHNFREMEKQGSIGGFRILAGDKAEPYHGYMWGDSDVYKTLEGAGYMLRTNPDPRLERRVEEIIQWIARAQAPDGFIFPHLQITEPAYRQFSREITGTCESYSMGHLIEAAVEHYRLTGRTNFLSVATRAADRLARASQEEKLLAISGHPEVELALVKLYRATGRQEYLDLAGRLVSGHKTRAGLWSNGKPALGDHDIAGHAVAVMYLNSGAADVGVMTGDGALLDLLDRKWDRMVARKMYITGGVGHRRHHEGFAADYDLPDGPEAYCETCAAIANVFWSSRMFRARGDARYYDVVERVLYNNLAAGSGLSGDRFFYVNPLTAEAGSKAERWAWHGCPCCPANLVRFWPRLSEYFFAVTETDLYVNLFAECEGRVSLAGKAVRVAQKTGYPWDGDVAIELSPAAPVEFALRVRIPGWAENRPLPSDLYRYIQSPGGAVELRVNGEPLNAPREKGYAVIRRTWKAGDRVEVRFPMPVNRVLAHESVSAAKGKIAIERGPLVYCAESCDNSGKVSDLVLPAAAPLSVERKEYLSQGISVIKSKEAMTWVPYCVWGYRGPGEMKVWIRRQD